MHTNKLTVLGLSLLTLLSACHRKVEREPLSPLSEGVDSISVDTTAQLGKGTANCKVHLNFLYLKGANKGVVNDSLLRLGALPPADYLASYDRLTPALTVPSAMRQYVKDYKQTAGLIYQQEKRDDQLHWSYRMQTKIYHGRGEALIYLATVSTYEGGDKSAPFTRAWNIDPKTGRTLHLKDYFNEDALKQLPSEIAKQLATEKDVKDLKALQKEGYFEGIEPYATDNFFVTGKQITFVYVPGEIAPAQAGEVWVTLNNSQLKMK